MPIEKYWLLISHNTYHFDSLPKFFFPWLKTIWTQWLHKHDLFLNEQAPRKFPHTYLWDDEKWKDMNASFIKCSKRPKLHNKQFSIWFQVSKWKGIRFHDIKMSKIQICCSIKKISFFIVYHNSLFFGLFLFVFLFSWCVSNARCDIWVSLSERDMNKKEWINVKHYLYFLVIWV